MENKCLLTIEQIDELIKKYQIRRDHFLAIQFPNIAGDYSSMIGILKELKQEKEKEKDDKLGENTTV